MTDSSTTAVNGGHLTGRIAVWVDPDLCVGDAGCADKVPEVFDMHDDGLAYIVGDKDHEGGLGYMTLVPEPFEERVRDEAEDCPGECIFVEVIGTTVDVDDVTLGR